jgi:hypothetical protein
MVPTVDAGSEGHWLVGPGGDVELLNQFWLTSGLELCGGGDSARLRL